MGGWSFIFGSVELHCGGSRLPELGLPVTIAALIVSLALVPSTAAANLRDDVPAADQYVEDVPTSRGPNATEDTSSQGSEKVKKRSLPANVETRLANQGGQAATKLKQIATSPEFGAPRSKLSGHINSKPSVLSAVIGDANDTGGGQLFWLLVTLLGITVFTLGTVGYRHQRRKNKAG